MNRQFKRYLQLSLIILDILVLNIAFAFARFFFEIPGNFFQNYLALFLFLNSFWLLLSFISGTYHEKIIINFETFTKRTVQVYTLWIIAIFFYLFFSHEYQVSRFFILAIITFFGVGLFGNRFLYVGIRQYYKSKDYLVNRVIILGYNDTALKLASYFEEEAINTHLLGFVEDEKNVKELTHYPILAGPNQLIQVAKDMDVQEIFSTITPEQNDYIYTLMSDAERECIRFKVVPNLAYFFSKPVIVDYIRDLPILSLRSEPLEDVGNRLKKRILDVTVSFLVCIFILSWLIPILGLLIIIESRGPIFFSQKRTGKNGQEFNCLKFRSMKPNKDSDTKQATKGDMRVTRIGRFIRKTSLDEFPQFLNVLKGEMSLVGPRPHMVKHTTDYSKIVDQYMIRHFLKPGITGWAQINGFRGEITDPKQIKMRVTNDLWYLENWNIWLDLRIMFLTVYNVFKGEKNAY
ncbi:MAG: undecaprenyl-phosphate glucose phosphotransferase [Bacteroidetes bacterium]|nr:undecaprenyl-phosphate glucose phosphotransferase [Bacteroidota bacterium]